MIKAVTDKTFRYGGEIVNIVFGGVLEERKLERYSPNLNN
jgi:hypothetical protein